MRNLTQERNEAIAESFKKGTSEEDIASEYNIGTTYIRTILRDQGLLSKQPRKDLSKRDTDIRNLFKSGKTIDEIAVQLVLTPTRIRQIVQDEASELREKELEESKKIALKLIEEGKSYEEIQEQIGEGAVKRLKYRAKLNIFKLVVQRRAAKAVELYNSGKKPGDIFPILGCTRDYVYMLLRSAGVQLNITKDEKRQRDKDIFAFLQAGGKMAEAAEKWVLSETMIKIIHGKQLRAIKPEKTVKKTLPKKIKKALPKKGTEKTVTVKGKKLVSESIAFKEVKKKK